MSLLIRTLAVVALAAAGASAQAADVGVSVQVSQPGVYGRIDIGRFPQPQVVVQQPVIIAAPPPPRAVVGAPPGAAEPSGGWATGTGAALLDGRRKRRWMRPKRPLTSST